MTITETQSDTSKPHRFLAMLDQRVVPMPDVDLNLEEA